MKKIGLKPTLSSGSGWVEKEDGENDFILAQLKSTDAKSIKIDKLDIEKLEYHANISNKVPLFVVQFLVDDSLYFVLKPEDLGDIYNYLVMEEGSSNVRSDAEDSEVNDLVKHIMNDIGKQKPKKIIKSSGREKFWELKEKEYKKRK